jgi:hypothetical protein
MDDRRMPQKAEFNNWKYFILSNSIFSKIHSVYTLISAMEMAMECYYEFGDINNNDIICIENYYEAKEKLIKLLQY